MTEGNLDASGIAVGAHGVGIQASAWSVSFLMAILWEETKDNI